MESECKIDCDISYDIVSDLLGLTMLVYDYGKKFTIEKFISSTAHDANIFDKLSDHDVDLYYTRLKKHKW